MLARLPDRLRTQWGAWPGRAGLGTDLVSPARVRTWGRQRYVCHDPSAFGMLGASPCLHPC